MKKGFTLIELLVVISIIALLASIVLASLNSARDKGRMGAAKYFAAQVDHIAGEQGIGFWDFDECTGSTTADSSGFGYAGTLNGASWSLNTPSGRGCAALFDGVNDYVDTLYPGGDNTTWTISAWVYDTKANGNYRAIVQTTAQANGDFALYIYPGNYLGFYNCGAVGPALSGSFSSNQWTHVAATYDSATGFKYYVDGIEKGYRIGSCPAANHWDFIHIGAIDTADAERWKGMIDNVHVFAKTLTGLEIQRLYATEKEKFFAGK